MLPRKSASPHIYIYISHLPNIASGYSHYILIPIGSAILVLSIFSLVEEYDRGIFTSVLDVSRSTLVHATLIDSVSNLHILNETDFWPFLITRQVKNQSSLHKRVPSVLSY